MDTQTIEIQKLSVDERIALIGMLWDSLDASLAAPVSPELAAELRRREAEADARPDDGEDWASLKLALESKLQ